jgi:hypothetical protein
VQIPAIYPGTLQSEKNSAIFTLRPKFFSTIPLYVIEVGNRVGKMELEEIKKGLETPRPLSLLAGTTRLELATSGVTGRRSNQAELRPRALVVS